MSEEIKRDQKLVRNAMSQARKLKRPPEITKVRWRTVQNVLVQLASRVPNVWPSQRWLAEKTGYSRSTIQVALDAAEAVGLLKRTVHPFKGRLDGTEYELPWWVPLGPETGPSLDRKSVQAWTGNRSVRMSSSSKKEEKAAAVPNTTSLREVVSDPPGGRGGDTQAEERQPPNKKPGYCVGCGIWLTVGEGTYQENEDGRLRAVHHRCHGSEPGSRDPVDEENAIQARQVLKHYRAFQAEIEAAKAAGLPTAEISERYGFLSR